MNNADVFGRILPGTTWRYSKGDLVSVKSIHIDAKNKPVVVFYRGSMDKLECEYLGVFLATISDFTGDLL